MITLRVLTASGEQRLLVTPGQSVREALDTTALRVRAACGGTGTCGACLVQLLSGQVNPCTLAEHLKLTADERARGLRLACQLRPAGETLIRLDDPAPPSEWKSIPPEELAAPPGGMPELAANVYGVAVDLGTTHIRVALWDRRRGKRIATRRGPNPQALFGADVLNRLDTARLRPERAGELAQLARAAIVQALRDMLARDVGEVTPMLARIGRVVVVGNTAMLALLTGRGGGALLDPDNWERPVDCRPEAPEEWRAAWHLPNAEVVVAPPLAGFVGSDLAADLLATGLTDGPGGAMLVDVGTNTEITLWDGRNLAVTSVPGGPAFEGAGLRFGMPAEPGAIYRVAATPAGGLACATIGEAEARGFCGSGLLDAVATLRATGVLKPSGRFATPPDAEGLRLIRDNPRSALAGSDIDAFQRAKAATAAAMTVLMRRAGMGWPDLRRLCICGAFGHTLDLDNAQAVGLLPPLDPDRIELFGDAALAGCERALLLPDGEAALAAVAARARPVNLAHVEAYDEIYIDQLRLVPCPPSPIQPAS